jgi:ABC-type cobalamin/Fe3+-siderophores transport system ATPase subunit
MKYRLFDFVLESDIELPELEPAKDVPPAIRLIHDPGGLRLSEVRWFHTIEGWHQEPWVEIGRAGAGFVLKFCEGPVVQHERNQVWWWLPSGFDQSIFRHVLLDQALPLIVAQTGRRVLHGACVWRDGEATLLIGPAGAGKSTLAAVLARDAEMSAADDAVAVRDVAGEVTVCPEYGGLRLWPDACDAIGYRGGNDVSGRSDKRRFGGALHAEGDLRLRAVYVLAPARDTGTAPRIAPLTRREAAMALLRNSYVLDIEDRARAAAHLDAVAEIAARVPVRKLILPRRFDALSDVHRVLARDLAEGVTA